MIFLTFGGYIIKRKKIYAFGNDRLIANLLKGILSMCTNEIKKRNLFWAGFKRPIKFQLPIIKTLPDALIVQSVRSQRRRSKGKILFYASCGRSVNLNTKC